MKTRDFKALTVCLLLGLAVGIYSYVDNQGMKHPLSIASTSCALVVSVPILMWLFKARADKVIGASCAYFIHYVWFSIAISIDRADSFLYAFGYLFGIAMGVLGIFMGHVLVKRFNTGYYQTIGLMIVSILVTIKLPLYLIS